MRGYKAVFAGVSGGLNVYEQGAGRGLDGARRVGAGATMLLPLALAILASQVTIKSSIPSVL